MCSGRRSEREKQIVQWLLARRLRMPCSIKQSCLWERCGRLELDEETGRTRELEVRYRKVDCAEPWVQFTAIMMPAGDKLTDWKRGSF